MWRRPASDDSRMRASARTESVKTSTRSPGRNAPAKSRLGDDPEAAEAAEVAEVGGELGVEPLEAGATFGLISGSLPEGLTGLNTATC